MKEIWKKLNINSDVDYYISNCGFVKNKKNNCKLKNIVKNNKKFVSLCTIYGNRYYSMDKLLYKHFSDYQLDGNLQNIFKKIKIDYSPIKTSDIYDLVFTID